MENETGEALTVEGALQLVVVDEADAIETPEEKAESVEVVSIEQSITEASVEKDVCVLKSELSSDEIDINLPNNSLEAPAKDSQYIVAELFGNPILKKLHEVASSVNAFLKSHDPLSLLPGAEAQKGGARVPSYTPPPSYGSSSSNARSSGGSSGGRASNDNFYRPGNSGTQSRSAANDNAARPGNSAGWTPFQPPQPPQPPQPLQPPPVFQARTVGYDYGHKYSSSLNSNPGSSFSSPPSTFSSQNFGSSSSFSSTLNSPNIGSTYSSGFSSLSRHEPAFDPYPRTTSSLLDTRSRIESNYVIGSITRDPPISIINVIEFEFPPSPPPPPPTPLPTLEENIFHFEEREVLFLEALDPAVKAIEGQEREDSIKEIRILLRHLYRVASNYNMPVDRSYIDTILNLNIDVIRCVLRSGFALEVLMERATRDADWQPIVSVDQMYANWQNPTSEVDLKDSEKFTSNIGGSGGGGSNSTDGGTGEEYNAVNNEGGVYSDNTESHPSSPVGHKQKEIIIPSGTNSRTSIHGREYSGHALDRMQERGLTPTIIEHAIKNGVQSPGNVASRILHYDSVNKVTVVTENGNVITVISGG